MNENTFDFIQNEYTKTSKWKTPTTLNRFFTLKRRLMRNICNHLKNDKMKKEFLENLKSYEWDTKWDADISRIRIEFCWRNIICHNTATVVYERMVFPLLSTHCPFCKTFYCSSCPWKYKHKDCVGNLDSVFRKLSNYNKYVYTNYEKTIIKK